MSDRPPARAVIELLLDDPVELGGPSESPDPLDWPDYGSLLEQARSETGCDEAVVVARGRVSGSAVECVAAVWEFGFLGGSMGVVVGERVARAFEEATERRLPVVLLPATGGARMQEGMASLVQMAKTVVASRRHAEAGLLQVAVLRDPTTGGVFASHANIADVVVAEPGATIGFAGPRVAEAMTGGALPEGSHTAEGAREAGLVDLVVPRDQLVGVLAATLAWPGDAPTTATATTGPGTDGGAGASAWAEVQRARDPARPRADRFLAALEVAVELHGDRAGTDDPSIRVVLGWLDARPLVAIAMDRDGNEGRISPAGYRKAWRGLAVADRLGVPVVTFIDTPGADASAPSEAGGIAHHIARTFAEVLAVRAPVVSLVIGEGGSGGALALAVGDRLLIQEHAIFSVIGPEGAAAILHRDRDRAPEVAELLDPTATRLERLGIADEVVPEPHGDEVEAALSAVGRHLDELADIPREELVERRRMRWRGAGGTLSA